MTLAYYDDVFAWFLAIARDAGRPCVLGVNGPQGCGKTTLVRHLVPRFAAKGLKAVALSIDDFYLTRVEQLALADAHPGNRYLQRRGYPGTHDVSLGARTIDALQRSGSVAIPRYDKSAYVGAGDRAPESAWTQVTAPVDVILFEGWMLGFEPVYEIPHDDRALAIIDGILAAYAPWKVRLDALLQLRMAEDSYVVRWRVEAEEAMKAAGRPGMSNAEIRAYIDMFLPAYALYPHAMLAAPPVTPFRSLVLDATRQAVARH